eukprot:gnl/TRDRNA2_/TRDRNA2_90783_c0_seq1.p1 gnl/TRDRNA2_/TRDRNA2_90783_c0~~gnl/TRDRNA2_/TRDRNA2_90783_c0_seq1.p1  ORF type:complete len:313 (+),score=28.86 gnl/TRDRNA2_/TRDRNA2_90783_c0_seq1:52-939(+)
MGGAVGSGKSATYKVDPNAAPPPSVGSKKEKKEEHVVIPMEKLAKGWTRGQYCSGCGRQFSSEPGPARLFLCPDCEKEARQNKEQVDNPIDNQRGIAPLAKVGSPQGQEPKEDKKSHHHHHHDSHEHRRTDSHERRRTDSHERPSTGGRVSSKSPESPGRRRRNSQEEPDSPGGRRRSSLAEEPDSPGGRRRSSQVDEPDSPGGRRRSSHGEEPHSPKSRRSSSRHSLTIDTGHSHMERRKSRHHDGDQSPHSPLSPQAPTEPPKVMPEKRPSSWKRLSVDKTNDDDPVILSEGA